MRISVPAAATAAFLLCAAMSASGADYTGFWKTDCANPFGVSIRPEGDRLYGIYFCTPGGCKPWRPRTTIDGDAHYRVVDVNTIESGPQRWQRCTTETNPKLEWAKAEPPAPAQPSAAQAPIPQNLEAGDYAFKPPPPRTPPERLNALWLGNWRSQDGTATVTVATSKMVYTFQQKDQNDRLRTRTLEFEWSPSTEGGEGGDFGYRAERTTPEMISAAYEKAVRQFKEDPTDYAISDPATSRQAIAAISPGAYRIVWSYDGGDCGGWDYILDKDRMLQFSECKYGFEVVLFNRVTR